MADRPIPFSAPMVRALIEGRKTQTRRIAKFVEPDGDGWHIHSAGGGMIGADDDAVMNYGPDYAPVAEGDRLWVRESYYHRGHWEPVPGAATKQGRQKWRICSLHTHAAKAGFSAPR